MLRRIKIDKMQRRAEPEPQNQARPAPRVQADAPVRPGQSPRPAGPTEISVRNPSGRLGEILVEEKIVTPSQLSEALEKQREVGGFLGQALIDLGHLDQDTLTLVLVKQCKIPHLNLLDYTISSDIKGLIPEELCRRHNVLPIDKMGKILTVAMVDPLNTGALEAIRAAFPELRVKPILCDWPHIQQILDQVFPRGSGKSRPMEMPPGAPAQRAPETGTDVAHDRASVEDRQSNAERLEKPAPQVLSSTPSASGTTIDSDALKSAIRDGMRESVAELDRKIAEASQFLREVREIERATVTARQQADLGAAPAERPHVAVAPASCFAEIGQDGPGKELTFENFIVGSNNAPVVETAKSVCTSPGGEHNPFFVHGDVGLGKTHLITAIGHALKSAQPGRRVGWASAGRFADGAIAARGQNAQEAFRRALDEWDVIILDDVQFLAGRVEAQEDLFHIFNAMQERGSQIVLAADRAPDRLGLLEKRLVSRFDSGLVAAIHAPDWETRMRILRHYAQRMDVGAPDDALAMIAMRHPNDVRRLIGALRRIVARTKTSGGAVTAQLASEILAESETEAAA